MEHRQNEEPKTWFRSERFFRSDDKWYFYTREGVTVGPYRTQFEAEVDAEMLMARLKGAPERLALSIIREFVMACDGDLDYVNDPAFTSYLTDEGASALSLKAV
jgi:hypothetical protein